MQKKLENSLGIKINDIAFFEMALTHRSAVNEQKKINAHNERLEFLGDAVLELVVTDYLYKNFPKFTEGELTSLRASLVKGETLARITKKINLAKFLKMSKGEDRFGGREKTSLLANTFEAIIGAVYLDSGIENSRNVITKHLVSELEEIIESGEYIDAKSHFQQISQADFKTTPHYKEVSAKGPDHEKIFEIAVFVGKKEYGRGKGASKQAAQQVAAKDALEKMEAKLVV
jgi:ribonuclease III